MTKRILFSFEFNQFNELVAIREEESDMTETDRSEAAIPFREEWGFQNDLINVLTDLVAGDHDEWEF